MPTPDSLSPVNSAVAPASAPASDAKPEIDVPRGELIAYSLPEASNNIAGNVMSSLANPILVTTLGMSPASVGFVLMLRGLWDAVTDPVMGFVSDNFRNRFGRRRPFILAGGLLMALTMIFAWWFPTTKGDTITLIFFGVGVFAFATAQTIFSVPYGALGFELSSTYHGRTRVQMGKALSSRVASFAGPYLFPFCLLGVFGGALTGVRWLSALVGVLVVVSVVITFLKTKERTQTTAAKDNFFKAILSTARCPEFLRITFIYAALLFTLGAFGVFQYFLVIYYVFAGEVAKGAAFSALVETFANVLVLVAIPVISWACKRFQKHNALRIALGLMIVGSCLQLVLINPTYPWLMFFSPFFYSLGIVATFMILGTLMADAVDADELRTGQRREGLFSATAAFMMKSMLAIAVGLSGVLIEATGFDVALGGNQAPGVFDNMRHLFAAKAVLMVACLAVLHKYPLTQERLAEIQAELKLRRDAAKNSA
jgi:GPH family glycoside/pentoside/hexuronide:cation symporter